MMVEEFQGSDIFVIQTLYDGKWRCDEQYICEEKAQAHAALLVPDWGGQRVRLLMGHYDVEQEDHHYYQMVIVPPKSRYKKAWDKALNSTKHVSRHLKTRIAASALIAVTGVGLALIGFSALTSSTSQAGSDAKMTAIAPVVAQADKGSSKSLRQIFASLSATRYAQPVTLKDVPIRLRGDWSRHCATGLQDLQLFEKMLTEFDGAIAKDLDLNSVYQAGQTYGLVTAEGDIRMLELVSIDQVKMLGHLNKDGQFSAVTEEMLLQRCI